MKNFLNIKLAFSIAEMLIVMLILSIILAASMPIITHRVSASNSVSGDDIPVGTIAIWSGSVSSIPSGWKLCDGSNGTPDLRSRFIYGAGGTDAMTSKTPTVGWGSSVTQHWPVGAVGGEEMHQLVETITGTGITMTQQKIFLPRFICLAYIMKVPYSNTVPVISVSSP